LEGRVELRIDLAQVPHLGLYFGAERCDRRLELGAQTIPTFCALSLSLSLLGSIHLTKDTRSSKSVCANSRVVNSSQFGLEMNIEPLLVLVLATFLPASNLSSATTLDDCAGCVSEVEDIDEPPLGSPPVGCVYTATISVSHETDAYAGKKVECTECL
jgi:hypothetical protein